MLLKQAILRQLVIAVFYEWIDLALARWGACLIRKWPYKRLPALVLIINTYFCISMKMGKLRALISQVCFPCRPFTLYLPNLLVRVLLVSQLSVSLWDVATLGRRLLVEHGAALVFAHPMLLTFKQKLTRGSSWNFIETIAVKIWELVKILLLIGSMERNWIKCCSSGGRSKTMVLRSVGFCFLKIWLWAPCLLRSKLRLRLIDTIWA